MGNKEIINHIKQLTRQEQREMPYARGNNGSK